MNWGAIGAIGEILGAIGVIATLLYLTTQIRQNTKALRVSSFHASTQSLIGDNHLVAGDGELASLVARGLSEDEIHFSPAEQVRLDFLVTSNFRTFEEAFCLRDEGVLGAQSWQRVEVALERLIQNVRVQEYWLRGDFGFDEKFKGYVDSRIEASTGDGA
jgi:hypothetical protein